MISVAPTMVYSTMCLVCSLLNCSSVIINLLFISFYIFTCIKNIGTSKKIYRFREFITLLFITFSDVTKIMYFFRVEI